MKNTLRIITFIHTGEPVFVLFFYVNFLSYSSYKNEFYKNKECNKTYNLRHYI